MGFKLVRVDATEPCKIPLPVGTHLIGRGKFLDCNDHRVSRMHGKLKVTDDVVTITSLHQNPCFYRKKDVSTIHVLHHNSCIELNNGDQFGLIPDGFWYEVIYCIENVQLQPASVVTPFMRVVKPEGERSQPSESGSSGDTSQISELTVTVGPSTSHDSTTTDSQDTITSDQDPKPSPSKRAHPDSPSYNMKKPKIEPSSPTSEQYRPNETNSPSNNNQNSSENHDQKMSKNIQGVSNNNPSSSENTQGVSNNNQSSSENTQGVSNNNQSLSESIQVVSNNNQHSPENTQDVNYNDENLSDNLQTDPNIVPKNEPNNDDSFNNGLDKNDLPGDVKREPESPENVKAGPSQDQQGDQKPVAAGAGGNVGGVAAAVANNGRPREKCMYGERCYRVNPIHKAQFSHPGDADWAAVRVCPRGAGCRDVRPAHWRDNVHPQLPHQPHQPHQPHNDRPGIRVVQRHGNIFYINAHSVHFYDDHFQVQDSDGESVDYDYEF